MRPARLGMLPPVALVARPPDLLRMFAQRGGLGEIVRRPETVSLVPSQRIALQRRDHLRELILEAMMGSPAQQFLGAADIQRIMVVCKPDHEGLDERLLTLVDCVGDDGLELILSPDTDCRHRLWHSQRRPVLDAVDEISDLVLQRIIPQRFGLADQDLRIGRQRVPALNGETDRFDNILSMDHGLAH